MENLPEIEYLKSHLKVLDFFLRKIKPANSIELGCSEYTTIPIDNVSVSHLVYDSSNRAPYVSEVENCNSYISSEFILYTRIEEVLKELDLFKVQYDLGVVSGPRSDRSVFAQKLLDTKCKCVILLDYESDIYGYSKIRKPQNYDFRSFYNRKTGIQTGVYLINYLSAISIENHE